MGLVFILFLQWNETSTHACINFKRKVKKLNEQTNQLVWMLICIIIIISTTVNDMKRVERKITEIKTKTIDLTVTQKNMPFAIDSGK